MFTASERLTALEAILGADYKTTNNKTHYNWACIYCLNEGGDNKGDNFHFDTILNKYNCFANKDHTRHISFAIREYYKGSKKKKSKEPLDPISITELPQEFVDYLHDRKMNLEALDSLGVKFDRTYGLFIIKTGLYRNKLKCPSTGKMWWEQQFLGTKKFTKEDEERLASEYPATKYKAQKHIIILEGIPDIWSARSFFSHEFLEQYYITATVNGCTYIPPTWKEADYWNKFETITIIPDQDQNNAGQNAAKKLAAFIKNKKVNIITLPFKHKRMIFGEELEYRSKDFNDWVIEGGTQEEFLKLLDTTSEYDKIIDQTAWDYLRNPNLIDEFLSDMEKLGIVGEKENLFRIYLCCLSHKFESCLGLVLKGATSSGKTTIMKAVTRLMPEGIVHNVSSQSEKALNYWTDIAHKIIVITEERPPEDSFWEVMSAWRQLIEDNEITRIIVDNNEKDIHKKRKEIKIKGPIVYLSTTTQSNIHEENENRLYAFHTNDSQEHVGDVIRKILDDDDDESLEPEKQFIIAKHRKAVELLQPFTWNQIKMPFKKQIQFGSYGPEAMRDIKKLLKAVKLITFLHQYQREAPSSSSELPLAERRKQTTENYASIPQNNSFRHSLPARDGLISSLGDYNLAVCYFKDYFDANSSDISKDLQDKWTQIYKFSGDDSTFTYDDCKKKWNLKKSRVQVLVKQMLEKNMIVQVTSSDGMFNKMEGKKSQYRCIAWNLAGSGLAELNSSPQLDVNGGRTNSEESTADSTVNASAGGLPEAEATDQQLDDDIELSDELSDKLKELNELDETQPN